MKSILVVSGEQGWSGVVLCASVHSSSFFVLLYLDSSGDYTDLDMGSMHRMKLQRMISYTHRTH